MKTNVNNLRAAGINFMHFREVGKDGKVLPYGGATVAYKVEDDGSIVVSQAYCRNDEDTGKRDNFNRKVGALIAGGRILAFLESNGNNDCAVRVPAQDIKMWREEAGKAMLSAYGLVHDFQIKQKAFATAVAPQALTGIVDAGVLHVQV